MENDRVRSAKRLRHNVAGVYFLLRHPAGLIPFPFGFNEATFFGFLFFLFLLKKGFSGKGAKRRKSKQIF